MFKYLLIFCTFFYFLVNDCNSDWAKETLEKMSLDEKIGQLFIVAIDNSNCNNESIDKSQNLIINNGLNQNKKLTKDEIINLIKKFNLGGIHFIGYGTLRSCKEAIDEFQSYSKIPLFFTQDFEWGLSMRLKDALRFPRNMTLGAIEDDSLIYEMAKIIAKQCIYLGISVNFAPVVDINNNPSNPVIGDRSFGENKEKVAKKAVQFMKGLQDFGVIACAKHFCGHGDTGVDSHLDMPIINHSLSRLEEIELYTFKEVFKEGIKSVMSAHIHVPSIDSTNNIPITLSYKAMTELLQKKLGFEGLIFTDALNMKGVIKNFNPGEIELKAFLAGNDILLMPQNVETGIRAIKKALEDGEISQEELNRRVLKILKVKQFLKLNEKKVKKNFIKKNFKTKEATNLKEKLYESAITLVANDQKIIPLKNNQKIVFIQIGNPINNLNDSEIVKYLLKNVNDLQKFVISPNSDKKIWDELLNKIENSQIVILSLFEMNKYSKLNFGISKNELDFLTKLNKTNKNLILTIFGSPYSLKFFENFKNIILAYEDDEDAQIATAKVILGKLKAKGKLPVTASNLFYEGKGI